MLSAHREGCCAPRLFHLQRTLCNLGSRLIRESENIPFWRAALGFAFNSIHLAFRHRVPLRPNTELERWLAPLVHILHHLTLAGACQRLGKSPKVTVPHNGPVAGDTNTLRAPFHGVTPETDVYTAQRRKMS